MLIWGEGWAVNWCSGGTKARKSFCSSGTWSCGMMVQGGMVFGFWKNEFGGGVGVCGEWIWGFEKGTLFWNYFPELRPSRCVKSQPVTRKSDDDDGANTQGARKFSKMAFFVSPLRCPQFTTLVCGGWFHWRPKKHNVQVSLEKNTHTAVFLVYMKLGLGITLFCFAL